MNEINIYRYNSADLRAAIQPDATSAQAPGVMRGDTLNLSFTSATYIDFRVGDYCDVFNTRYILNRDIKYNKEGDRDWVYTVVMEGPYH